MEPTIVNPAPPTPPAPNKINKFVIIGLVVFAVFVLCLVGYYLSQVKNPKTGTSYLPKLFDLSKLQTLTQVGTTYVTKTGVLKSKTGSKTDDTYVLVPPQGNPITISLPPNSDLTTLSNLVNQVVVVTGTYDETTDTLTVTDPADVVISTLAPSGLGSLPFNLPNQGEPEPMGDDGLSETGAVDPTANWRTFTESSNAYSLKYPGGWKLRVGTSSGQSATILKLSDTSQGKVDLPGNTQVYPEYTIVVSSPQTFKTPGGTTSVFSIDGKSGIIFQEGEAPAMLTVSVQVRNNGKNYSFVYSAVAPAQTSTKYVDVFKQILSTVKFN
jgi:hypothetical protein